MAMETEQTTDGLVIGRNAVAELLAGGREIEHVLVANGERTGSIVPLIAKCKKQGVVVKYVDRRKLDAMCDHANHQGIVAVASAHDYVPLETILDRAEEKGERLFWCCAMELRTVIIWEPLSAPQRPAAPTGW